MKTVKDHHDLIREVGSAAGSSVMWVDPLLVALDAETNFDREWRDLGENVIRRINGPGEKVLELFSVAAIRLGKRTEPIDDEMLGPLREVCGDLPRLYSWTHHFGRYAWLSFYWARMSGDFSWAPAMRGAFACGPKQVELHMLEEQLWLLSCWNEIGFDVGTDEFDLASKLNPMTAIQRKIFEVLDGRAMTADALEAELKISRSTLFGVDRLGGITELMLNKVIDNDRKIGGYYRPDRPPRPNKN